MRIVINIKCNNEREVALEPRLDQSSSDNMNEINAGHALMEQLEGMFGKMEKKAVQAQSSMVRKTLLWILGIISVGYTLLCLWSMGVKWLAPLG